MRSQTGASPTNLWLIVMASHDDRIDQYIEQSADFARPILCRLRELVHRAAAEIEETIKWKMPYFAHGGLVCRMAAFNRHCAFAFRRHDQLAVAGRPLQKTAMGSFGRIESIDDLPPGDIVIDLVKAAVALNLNDASPRAKIAIPRQPELAVPAELAAALKTTSAARKTFNNFPNSSKRTMSNGSAKRRPRLRAGAGWPTRSNGWPTASGATGNTKSA